MNWGKPAPVSQRDGPSPTQGSGNLPKFEAIPPKQLPLTLIPVPQTSALFLPYPQLCCFFRRKVRKVPKNCGIQKRRNPQRNYWSKPRPSAGETPSSAILSQNPPRSFLEEASVTTVEFRTPLPRMPKDNAPPRPARRGARDHRGRAPCASQNAKRGQRPQSRLPGEPTACSSCAVGGHRGLQPCRHRRNCGLHVECQGPISLNPGVENIL